MSKSGNLSREFKRYSTGPLYSERQLTKVDTSLRADGFTDVADDKALQARIYKKPGTEDAAVVYLDALKCSPLLSGSMVVSQNGKTTATTVWQYAKQKSIENTKNPVLRGIRKTLRV